MRRLCKGCTIGSLSSSLKLLDYKNILLVAIGIIISVSIIMPVLTSAQAPTPFDCTSLTQAFLVRSAPGQLASLTTSPLTALSNIGGAAAVEYNALAFRRQDGFLYGVELLSPFTVLGGNNGIVRIDATGAVTNLGTPVGFPAGTGAAIPRFDAGTITSDGTTMYIAVGSATNVAPNNVLYSLDLTSLPVLPAVGSVTITGSTGAVNDWAYRASDGLLYGGNQTTGEVTYLDPATGIRVNLTTAGLPAGTSYGASWFNGLGQLILYQNAGNVYQITLSGGSPPTNASAALLGTDSAAAMYDGTSCVPLPEIELVKSGVLDVGIDGAATPGDLINYTFQVSNPGLLTLNNVLVSDPIVFPISCPSGNPIPTLAASVGETCTGSYAITQADIDAGMRDNTALAQGTDDFGVGVSDSANASVPITQNNAPVVGGDPPIWENIMVFPTPEKFEGRDLNNDGDLNDTILRYENLDTKQIFNTGISVSQNHRDIDIYGDNIVFVSRSDSLLSAIRRWFNPSGQIGVYNIKTKQTKMLDVWGDRPSIYQNTISISGSEIRFYDLVFDQVTETGILAYNQAIWGDWIAFEAADRTICLYNISSSEILKTGALGEFPTIHENIVAFERNEQLYYYDIESAEVTFTGYAGEDAVVYGDRIVFSANNKIYYYDISQQQAFSTGKSGLEPDIFEDVITYYIWENWVGVDVNTDGDRQDPIVNTFTISDGDAPLRSAIDQAEVATAAIHSIQGSRDAQGLVFNVQGAGIESSQLEVYSLSGRVVFDSGNVNGSQLHWNLKRQDGAVLANGVYLYRVLVTGASGEVIGSEVRKLLLLR